MRLFSPSIALAAALITRVTSKFVSIEDTADKSFLFKGQTRGSSKPGCALSCENGASCVKKNPIQEQIERLSAGDDEKEWECLCPEGYSGRLCEVQRRDLQVTCGSLTCQNGGKCGDGSNYDTTKALCDCSTAIVLEGKVPPYTLKQFVGPTCELEVLTNDYCAGNKDLFCANGGTCRVQAIDFEDVPCACLDGYTGRHCEYEQGQVQLECLLTCSQHGTCQHGFNPVGPGGVNELVPEMATDATQDFMHCVCDDGFAGPNCEYDYIKCAGKGEYCFHGSKCIADGSSEVCQCGTAKEPVAGRFCEYKGTDSCDIPVQLASQYNFFDIIGKMTGADFPFCVNNGICYQIVGKDEFYCLCIGATGIRCEEPVTPHVADPNASPSPSFAMTESPRPTFQASISEFPTVDLVGPNPQPSISEFPTVDLVGPNPQPTAKPISVPSPSPPDSSLVADAAEQPKNNLQGPAKFGVIFGTLMGFVGIMFLLQYIASAKSDENQVNLNSTKDTYEDSDSGEFVGPIPKTMLGEDDDDDDEEFAPTNSESPNRGSPGSPSGGSPKTEPIIV